MTTHYDAAVDPNTETVAAAWTSSPLGRLDDDDPADDGGFADNTERRPFVAHIVAVAVAGCVAVGAAVGLVFADFTPDQPTVAVPAVIVAPSVQAPAPAPAPVAAPASVAPQVPAAPNAPKVDAPPTQVADIPLPTDPSPAPAAEIPADPNPLPPVDPQPHFPDVFDIKLPEPKPNPQPPVAFPDLPLAPAPTPKPTPPSLPDFDISAGLDA